MGVLNKVLFDAVSVPITTASTPYTATNCRAIIDKMTATNITASNATLTVYLLAPGASASDAYVQIRSVSIAPNETYECPEVIGHVIENNGQIAVVSGTASAIVMRASGREIT